MKNFRVHFDPACYGAIGLAELGFSVRRQWGNDRRNIQSWRHIKLVFHSPLIRHPGRFYRDGKARWEWYRLRFGCGGGNLYLGAFYIVTTFGSQHPPLRYRKFWRFFQWASQPTMDEYIKGGNDR